MTPESPRLILPSQELVGLDGQPLHRLRPMTAEQYDNMQIQRAIDREMRRQELAERPGRSKAAKRRRRKQGG